MDTTPLADLGLSESEIRLYVALLELGSAKAGALIRATGLQNSVVHLTLGRLAAQGFVSYVTRGQTKIYQATDPNYFLNLVDSRRQRLEKLVPQLIKRRKQSPLQEAEIYEGLSGLRNMCYKLIEGAAPGDEFLFFSFHSANENFEKDVYKFYREYTDVRLERGLILKGIAQESSRARFTENQWPHHNIAFVKFPTIQNISICGNRLIMVPWDIAPISFLITSKSLADNFRAYFEAIWEKHGPRKLKKPLKC